MKETPYLNVFLNTCVVPSIVISNLNYNK
jgi:hypothetical protein